MEDIEETNDEVFSMEKDRVVKVEDVESWEALNGPVDEGEEEPQFVAANTAGDHFFSTDDDSSAFVDREELADAYDEGESVLGTVRAGGRVDEPVHRPLRRPRRRARGLDGLAGGARATRHCGERARRWCGPERGHAAAGRAPPAGMGGQHPRRGRAPRRPCCVQGASTCTCTLASSARSSTTVLATDSESPNTSAPPRLHPHQVASAIPSAVATIICTTAPGTAILRTASRSPSEKCRPTPNISSITPISAN